MTNSAFVGCSCTVGEGFPENLRDQYVYDRLVANHFNINRTNFGISGASNYRIFMKASELLKSKLFDVVFIQWAPVNRIWFHPGPDSHFFINDVKYSTFTYRNLHISSRELRNFKNLTLLLNHDYQNLLDLIDYCNFIELIALQTNTKIVFINGAVRWKKDLCTPVTSDLTTSLSDYSKEILDFKNRSDVEIIKYFTQLQKKFKDIDQSKWANIFDSVIENTVDVGPEGHHPGTKTYVWLAEKIINHINERKMF